MLRNQRLGVLVMVLVITNGLNGQRSTAAFQFGMHITRPYQVGDPGLKPGWSHNFWLGISKRKVVNAGSHLHTGLILNMVNYRFSSADSPKTRYASMTYLSIPIQMEYSLGKHTGILIGGEPKCYVGGYQFTAEPGNSSKIRYFSGENNPYLPLNLGFRLGVIYHAGPLHYFLQAGTDMLPFRREGPSEWYDSKLIFGFTLGFVSRKQ